MYIDLSDDFVKWEIMVKPRGNAISRFFSAAYLPKDLYIYLDGNVIIRDRSRNLNHSIELMQKAPYDQVTIQDIEEINHRMISKGYYLVNFSAGGPGTSSIEVFFAIESEAIDMINKVKQIDAKINNRGRKKHASIGRPGRASEFWRNRRREAPCHSAPG